jgi:hypothetical protein
LSKIDPLKNNYVESNTTLKHNKVCQNGQPIKIKKPMVRDIYLYYICCKKKTYQESFRFYNQVSVRVHKILDVFTYFNVYYEFEILKCFMLNEDQLYLFNNYKRNGEDNKSSKHLNRLDTYKEIIKNKASHDKVDQLIIQTL